jgi:hypothetical protein
LNRISRIGCAGRMRVNVRIPISKIKGFNAKAQRCRGAKAQRDEYLF